jgi:hypothetical protein
MRFYLSPNDGRHVAPLAGLMLLCQYLVTAHTGGKAAPARYAL